MDVSLFVSIILKGDKEVLQPVKDFSFYQIQAQLKYEEYDDLRELTMQEREELALKVRSVSLCFLTIYIQQNKWITWP